MLLIVGHGETSMFDVLFNLRDIEADESLTETLAHKKFGSSHMVWRHRCISGAFRYGRFVPRQVRDIVAIFIAFANSSYITDVMT